MPMKALIFLTLFCTINAAFAAGLPERQRIEVSDLAERRVTVTLPVRRLVLAEANYLQTLAFIHPHPASLIVGWAGKYRLDDGVLRRYGQRFPAIHDISEVGGWSADSFSVEKVIALRPDLVLMTHYQAPLAERDDIVQRLEKAGIPVLFVTSPPGKLPPWAVEPQLRLLGQVLRREAAAQRVIEFYNQKLARISERPPTGSRPLVLLDNYAGMMECCRAPGRHGLADFVTLAGGVNLDQEMPVNAQGQLNMETIVQRRPEVYIATGGSYLEGRGLLMGPKYSREDINQSLKRLTERRGFDTMPAVNTGRVHGAWTALINGPHTILLAEAMAHWIRPEAFADLQPDKTLQEINQRFLTVPMEGIYWHTLE